VRADGGAATSAWPRQDWPPLPADRTLAATSIMPSTPTSTHAQTRKRWGPCAFGWVHKNPAPLDLHGPTLLALPSSHTHSCPSMSTRTRAPRQDWSVIPNERTLAYCYAMKLMEQKAWEIAGKQDRWGTR
jgi:hypothetical protein